MRKWKAPDGSELWRRGRSVLMTSVLSLLLGCAVMLLYACAAARGWLPLARCDHAVMICLFLGAFPAALIMSRKEGRGILKTAAAASGICFLILILLGIAAGSDRIFSTGLLKYAICVCAGLLFGCAIYAFPKPKRKPRKRRYNKL